MSRILFINNTSELIAGTSLSLLLLVKHLRSSFQMAVALDDRPGLGDRPGELPAVLEKEGIPCFILPTRTWRYLPRLVWLIVRGRYDLVYANNFSGRSANAAWAASLTRRPFIWHIRESLTKDCQTRFFRCANILIANSQDTAERMKQFAPDCDGRVVTIPNGIALTDYERHCQEFRDTVRRQWGIPSDGLVLINVGRICNQKNQLGALEAAAAVMQIHPATWLVFAGPLQEKDYVAGLQQRAAALGLAPRVRLVGPLGEIAPHLLGSDVMIHTSRKESQGRVMLEAMAARLPVVAYDVGGIRDALVHGQTGFLAPFGDAAALAGFLQQLIASRELRTQMGAAGCHRVRQHFSAEQTARRVQDVIEQVLKHKDDKSFRRA